MPRIDATRLGVFSACLLALLSCAGPSGSTETNAPSVPPALARVDTLIERQKRRPVASSRDASPPPIADPSRLAPVPTDDSLARMTLEDAAQRFPYEPPERATPETEPDVDRRAPALRAYLQGKRALRGEDHELAVDRFRTASRLIPDAVEPWLALGETHVRSGRRLSAAGAYRRVIAIDPDNADALEYLSRQALALDQYEDAASYLFRLREISKQRLDPALPFIVSDRLGRALGELGYLRASAEMHGKANDLPERFTSPTRYSRELGELYRSAWSRELRIGDTWARLGDPARALTHYEEASTRERARPDEVLARRVYAYLRMGQPARAVKATVESILTERVRMGSRTSDLIEYLARELDDRSLLADALVQSTSLVDTQRSKALGPSLMRAGAVAMGPEEAAEFLIEQLDADSFGDGTVALLMELQKDRPPSAHAEILAGLVTRNPHDAKHTVELAAWAWGGIDELGDAITRSSSNDEDSRFDPSRMSDAELLTLGLVRSHHAKADSAIDAWTHAGLNTTAGAMAHVHRAQELIRLDRRNEATAHLEELKNIDDPRTLVEVARAWTSLEQYTRASELLDEISSMGDIATPVHAEVLLAQSELVSESRGDALEAYKLAESALDFAPGDHEALGRMLMIAYSIDGERSNELRERATELAISSAPSGHPISVLARTRRLISNQRQDIAFRVLEQAMESRPPNTQLESLYHAMLIANDLHERTLEWLREKRNNAPAEGAYVRWQAGALIRTDRMDEARALLSDRIATYPGDDESRLTLARIYRRYLDNPARADALILEMLDNRPRTPRRLLVRMEIERRRDDIHAMIDSLRGIGDRYGELNDEQRDALRRFARWARNSALRDPARTPESSGFIETLLELDPSPPVELHGTLAFLRVRTGQSPAMALRELALGAPGADAVDRAVERYAEDLQIASGVRSGPRPTTAHYRFLEEASTLGGGQRIERFVSWLAAVLATSSRVEGEEPSAPDSVRAALDSLGRKELITQLVRGVVERFNTERRGDVQPSAVSYSLAVMADNADAPDEQVDALYRLTLEYDPGHANANNNLGYRMLERGDDPREALELIERAYEREPDSPHILDSYGWALHKAGRNRDTENGPGAVTILRNAEKITRERMSDFQRRAARSRTTDQKNTLHREAFLEETTLVTIIAHLGDALWASGQREEAIERWNQAAMIVDSFAIRETPFDIPDPITQQYEKDAAIVRARVRSASEDRDPLDPQVPDQ